MMIHVQPIDTGICLGRISAGEKAIGNNWVNLTFLPQDQFYPRIVYCSPAAYLVNKGWTVFLPLYPKIVTKPEFSNGSTNMIFGNNNK